MSTSTEYSSLEEMIKRAIKLLEEVKKNLIGLILNGKAANQLSDVLQLLYEARRYINEDSGMQYIIYIILDRLNMLVQYVKAVEIRCFYLGSKRIYSSAKYIEGHLNEVLNYLKQLYTVIK